MPIIGATATGFFYPQSAVASIGLERNIYVLLYSIPQPTIPAIGITLTLTDGINSFVLTDCAIDKGSMRLGEDGNIMQVGLWGGVWRWNGEISGWYNRRNADMTIVAESKKTCRELATLLFQSMGVEAGDISALPGDDSDLPEVFWVCDDSYGALSWLCRSRGCRPALNVENNRGDVYRLGVGAALPDNNNVQDIANSFDANPPPQYLKACAGSNLYQSKLKMKPMLLEADGTLKERDQVSYNPGGVGSATGWVGADPDDPLPNGSPENSIAASKSYGRYWLLDKQADGTNNAPGYGPVTSNERLLPLLDETADDFDSGIGRYHRRAYLMGTVAVTEEPQPLENGVTGDLIEVDFRLIGELGLVITSVPLVKYDSQKRFVTADVFLVCSYHVQDAETFQYIHHSITRQISATGGGTVAIRRPDIVKRHIAQYDSRTGTNVTGVETNATAVDAALNGQLDVAQAAYQTVTAGTRRYRGVQPARIDGAIRQIRIRIDHEDGAHTWISRNSEWDPGVPRDRERQRIARDKRLEAQHELQEKARRDIARKRGDA